MSIDYEKLKIAHELTKLLDGCYVEILLGIDEVPSIKLFDENRKMLLICTWDIDRLLEKLQELTVPENPMCKYKEGEFVWRIEDEDIPWEFEICQISLDKDDDICYQDEFGAWWLEEQLYPSREALIDAQIEYWSKLKCEDGRHEYCDDATGYKSICVHCDKSEFPSSIKDAFNYLTTKFEGKIKEFQAQESCQHESDGYCYDDAGDTIIGYQLHKYKQQKCIKCGEFY